jgi:uncharacterized DUF497 family protein
MYIHFSRRYEWDPFKARTNALKHGVRFSDAVAVFGDDLAITAGDSHLGEERCVTIGMDAFARVLVVVYTWRGDAIRLISARKATRAEMAQYTRGEP